MASHCVGVRPLTTEVRPRLCNCTQGIYRDICLSLLMFPTLRSGDAHKRLGKSWLPCKGKATCSPRAPRQLDEGSPYSNTEDHHPECGTANAAERKRAGDTRGCLESAREWQKQQTHRGATARKPAGAVADVGARSPESDVRCCNTILLLFNARGPSTPTTSVDTTIASCRKRPLAE